MIRRLNTPGRQAVALVAFVSTTAFLTIAVIPPFYDWFCRVTGFGGATSVSEAAPDTILDQTIRIRFDASLEAGMPWEFRPEVPEMTVRIGETAWPSMRPTTPPTDPSPAQPATMSRPIRRAATSPRSTASASSCRSCNRANG